MLSGLSRRLHSWAKGWRILALVVGFVAFEIADVAAPGGRPRRQRRIVGCPVVLPAGAGFHDRGCLRRRVGLLDSSLPDVGHRPSHPLHPDLQLAHLVAWLSTICTASKMGFLAVSRLLILAGLSVVAYCVAIVVLVRSRRRTQK